MTGALYTGSKVTNYSSQTWSVVRFELGEFLPGQLYDGIDFVYVTLPTIERLTDHAGGTGIPELLEKWLHRVQSVIGTLRELPEARKFRSHYDEVEQAIETAEAELRSQSAGGQQRRSKEVQR